MANPVVDWGARIKVVAEELGATVEQNGEAWEMEVPAGEESENAWQPLMVYTAEGWLFVEGAGDPIGAGRDLVEPLRAAADCWYARVFIDKDDESGEDHLYVQAAFPLDKLDKDVLAAMIQEAADTAQKVSPDTSDDEDEQPPN